MGNPTHCVVCRGVLEQVTTRRIVDDHDTSEETLGSADEWREETVIRQIHCPRCQLLYRVVDPRER